MKKKSVIKSNHKSAESANNGSSIEQIRCNNRAVIDRQRNYLRNQKLLNDVVLTRMQLDLFIL